MENDPVSPKVNFKVVKFEDMKLKPNLLKDYKLEKPSILQTKSISALLKGKDVLIQGRSGVNRMTALLISVLQSIDHGVDRFQVLILVQTRYVALKYYNALIALGKYLKISAHLCIPRNNSAEDLQKLEEKEPQIVIGTPGKVHEFFSRGGLKPHFLKMWMLDDLEDLLGRGYQDQLQDMFQEIRDKVYPGMKLVYATSQISYGSDFINKLSNELKSVIMEYKLYIPDQYFVLIEKREDKFDVLSTLSINLSKVIHHSPCNTGEGFLKFVVYCNESDDANKLVEKLNEKSLEAFALHPDQDCNQNDIILNEAFYSDRKFFLVLAAVQFSQGEIIIPNAYSTIHYDISISEDEFIHRFKVMKNISKGRSSILSTSEELKILEEIRTIYDFDLEEIHLQ